MARKEVAGDPSPATNHCIEAGFDWPGVNYPATKHGTHVRGHEQYLDGFSPHSPNRPRGDPLDRLDVSWRMPDHRSASPKAASNDELPLPAWVPYSPDHLGPCCLVNRLFLQQFAFPIVISQVRDETMVRSTRGVDGKLRTRLTSVVLLRRAMGGARESERRRPASARQTGALELSGAASGSGSGRNAVANAGDVCARGGRISRRSISRFREQPEAGAANWSEGEADIDYFPAFADPEGDGLLIRISLTNRSQQHQAYCVDLLGGLDTQTEQFARKDSSFERMLRAILLP